MANAFNPPLACAPLSRSLALRRLRQPWQKAERHERQAGRTEPAMSQRLRFQNLAQCDQHMRGQRQSRSTEFPASYLLPRAGAADSIQLFVAHPCQQIEHMCGLTIHGLTVSYCVTEQNH